MISCLDSRWKMRRFLEGSLSSAESDSIRRHIDQCTPCSDALAEEAQRQEIVREDVNSPEEFTRKLLRHFPAPTVSTILFKYLCGTFAMSVFVGISIFAFWRRAGQSGRPLLKGVSWDSLSSLQMTFPWLERIVNNPVFNYLMLALLATLLTVAVIIIVDHPRGRRVAYASKVGRIHSL